MMLRKIILGLLYVILGTGASSQMPETHTSAEIYQRLKKLNVLGSVLYIAAHPDDENNSFLPYLAKEKMYHTAYLSLTRGDGGQNLIGPEQGIELGMIRTQELLAARNIDGAGQYFSRAYEFGFSKSADEALKIWDKEKILSDVVWVIRFYQPDVIIKRFPPDRRAGHGHHAASAILAEEAFEAAANPKRFAEHFQYGVKPWQAKRIVWNTYNFGSNNTTGSDQLILEVGDFNPLLGKSYGEIGGEARSMHKSQGEGRPRRRGELYEYFVTTKGPPATKALMDGIDTTWRRIAGGEVVEKMIDQLVENYHFDAPYKSLPALVNVYRAIKQLPQGLWRNRKLQQTQEVIEACAGLYTEAVTNQEYAVRGGKIGVNFYLNKRNNIQAVLKNITLISSENLLQARLQNIAADDRMVNFVSAPLRHSIAILDSTFYLPLGTNKNVSVNYELLIKDTAALSQPYWLEEKMQPGYFDVTNQLLIGEAESLPNYVARFAVEIESENFIIERPLVYKYTDQVKGERYQPLTVIPKLTVSVSPTVVLANVVPPVQPVLHINYTSNVAAADVPVTFAMQHALGVDSIKSANLNLSQGGGGSLTFKLQDVYKKGNIQYFEPVLFARINGSTETFSQNLHSIKYDHIPNLHYFSSDTLKIITEPVKTIGKKIGYITGAGDKVPDALLALGYDITYLGEMDLIERDLQQYHAIIVGIRAHNIHEYLTNNSEALNAYVQKGGNLIVQYFKGNQVGSKQVRVGPYPFTVTSGSRVTEENAAVTFLMPNHPFFNYPNKITQKDFDGWVQERSTYQAEQADSRYEKLLAMHDTNENESNGSVLVAKYGKGNFAYVSLVLFRQLPAGVPGAYRILANLIALPQNK